MYVSLGLLLLFFITVHGEMIQCFVGNYNLTNMLKYV